MNILNKVKSVFGKIKELNPFDSKKKVKELIKEKKNLKKSDLVPGNLVFTTYDAKYKEFTFDKTPLVLILKRNNTHTLGLNFHWIPVALRFYLISHIMKLNEQNIKNNKPLQFSYKQLKPMLKEVGYAPCIRLYINGRIGGTGVIIPPDRLAEVARLKTETFTNGKYSAEQLWAMARKKHAKSRKVK